jgi:hypothetical protein
VGPVLRYDISLCCYFSGKYGLKGEILFILTANLDDVVAMAQQFECEYDSSYSE